MQDVFFERLTALDAAFLSAEGGGAHMHIACLMRFAAGDVAAAGGGIDIDALRRHTLGLIEAEPRLRQRLAFTPVLGHPYWVDDDNFRLDYHIRHVALPRPGDDEQLKRVMARVVSHRLDRQRPLWEQWIIEGLADGDFAMIHKFHHCMLDGMAAMGMLARLVKSEPGDPSVLPARPAPTAMQLLEAELAHRGRSLRAIGSAALAEPVDPQDQEPGEPFGTGMKGLGDALLHRSPRTRLNPAHLSEHRRFEMFDLPLDGIRVLKRQHRVTLNDISLAVVTGGLRAFTQRMGIDPASLLPFRAMVPISTGGKDAKRKLGNAVSMMIVDLPLDETDPVEQLTRIHTITERAKAEGLGVDSARWVTDLDDQLGLGLLGSAFRWGGKLRPYNVLVTSVPGPPRKVNLFGAELQGMYGAVPLLEQQGVAIAIFTYARTLHFGLQADYDALEDLELLVEDLRQAHEALCAGQPKLEPAAAASSSRPR